jgi:anti-anti-sigma factor
MTTGNVDSSYVAPDVLSLAVVGEIDMASAVAFDAAIDNALDVDGVTRVLIDLDRTTFLDSTGVRSLLRGHGLAHERGISFRILNPTRVVRRVLELTGVFDLLTCDA